MLCNDFARDIPKRDKDERGYDDNIIKTTNHRNKVRDQIEWHQQVANRQIRNNFATTGVRSSRKTR